MISGLLKVALSKVGGYLVAGLGFLAVMLGLLSRAKKSGRDEVIAKTKETEVENVKKAAKVERDVATRKPDAKRERLSKKWTRD